MSDKIKVGIKVRPLIAREKDAEEHWIVVKDGLQQIEPVSMKPRAEPYYFDHVFTPDSTNREVFEILVKPIVQSAVRGFNGTIFAYGQTSSGKTYTMMGDKYELGIVPLAVDFMFKEIENSRGREYLLRVAYMEIYNEKINDLLKKGQVNLKVNEDSFGNVVVKDLTENIVNTPQMCMDFMKKGEQIRKIGETNMNDRSSRSHTIFRVIIESREVGGDADDVVQVSHLNLVDLAGSERADSTGAVGERLKEGCAINKSLFMLSHVIAKLSDGEPFVNFRDSRLTRILQSSLGGNALTAIICAVTPASCEETLSTLGFASRARNIKNTAQVNEVVSDAALLKRYARKINELKSQLEEAKQSKSVPCVQEYESKLQEQEERNRRLQERLDSLVEKLIVSHGPGPDDSNEEQRLRTLRRRTWTAPSHMKKSRFSLHPLKPTISFSSVPEEGFGISTSSKLSVDSEFGTPLEEFEKDLLRRCPSPLILDEDEEIEDGVRPDPRFVCTRRGRSSSSSYRSSSGSGPTEDNERLKSVSEKLPEQISSDVADETGNGLAEDIERLREENEKFKKEIENEKEIARATIVCLEGTIQDQVDQIQSLKAESEELAVQVQSAKEAAQAEILSLGKTVQKQADQIKSLIAENEEFATQIKSLKAVNEEFATQVKSLKAENEEFVARVGSEKEDGQAEISSLEESLRNQADQIKSLIAENEAFALQLKKDKEDAEGKITSLMATVTFLESELETSRSLKTSLPVGGEETPKTKLRREFTEELNELKNFTRLEKQAYNEELENAVSQLQKELDAKVEAESDLQSKLNSLTQRCSELEKVKEEFEIIRRENLTEVDLKVLLMDSNKAIAKLTDTNKELQNELQEAKDDSKNMESLQTELETLRRDFIEVKHKHQELQSAHKSQLARMKDLEEERFDFDIKMDVIKKQFGRREQELTVSLEEAWSKLKAFESGDPIVCGDEALLGNEVKRLTTENEIHADQDSLNREERIKELTETISSLERQLVVLKDEALLREEAERLKSENQIDADEKGMEESKESFLERQLVVCEDEDFLRKEVERLRAENLKYASEVDFNQERIKELAETVNSLERQLSIFRSTDVTRKGRLSTLYVLEEEPSIGELSDEVYGLRTENRQYKLQISDLEALRDEYQQQIATLTQQLEAARAEKSAGRVETVTYSAVNVSRNDVSYSECDVTLQRGSSDVASLLAEIEELRRLSNVRTEENLELRAALEKMSNEAAKQEEAAEEVLNRSFIDESNTAEAEEYITCTDDILGTTSKSSSAISFEKMNEEGVSDAKLQEKSDEPKDVCIKRKHESAKAPQSWKEEYEGDVLDDMPIPTSCEVSLIYETATPDFKAKKRRLSRKFVGLPKNPQDSPIREASSFEELEEANSCLELGLENERKEVFSMQKEIEALQEKLSSLSDVQRENYLLKEEITDLQDRLLSVDAIKEERDRLIDEVAALQEGMTSTDALKEEKDQLEREVAVLQERIGTLDNIAEERDRLAEELSALQDKIAMTNALKEERDRLINELASLQGRVDTFDTVKEEKDKLIYEVDTLQKRIAMTDALKEERDLLLSEIASLQERIATAGAIAEEKDRLAQEFASTQNKITTSDELGEKRDRLVDEVASLQDRIASADAVTEERDRLVQELATLQGKIATSDALKEERDRLVDEVASLQERIASADAVTEERDRLMHELATLQDEIATSDALKEERDRLLCEIASLQERITITDSVTEERDRLVQEFATLQEKIATTDALKEERDRLLCEVASLQERIAITDAATEKEDFAAVEDKVPIIDALKKERDLLVSEVATLQERIATVDALREERDRLVQEIALLRDKIVDTDALKEERNRVLCEVSSLQERIENFDAVTEERDRLVEEIAVLQDKISTSDTLKEERDQLAQEMLTLQEKIITADAVKEERDRLVCEIATLEERMVTFDILKEEKARLQEEVMRLRLISPDPFKSCEDPSALKEESDSRVQDIIMLEKERVSLSAKNPDESVKDYEADQWEDKVVSVRRQIVSLQENVALDLLKQEKERLEEKLAKESARIAQIEKELELSSSNIAILKEDNRSKAEKIENLEGELARISGVQIFSSDSLEISRLQEQLQEKIEKIAVIEEQLVEGSKLREDLAILEKENSLKTDRLVCLEGELATLKERLQLQEEPKGQVDSKTASLQEEVLALQRKITILGYVNVENERLEKEVGESLEQISNLNAELSELRVVAVDSAILKEDLASLEKECSEKNDKLVSLEAEVVGLKSELLHCEDETKVQKELVSKLRKDLESKQEEIVLLQEKMIAFTEEKKRLQKALEEKIEEKALLGNELAELKIVAMGTARSKEDNAHLKQRELESVNEHLCLNYNELQSLKEDLCQKESEMKSLKEDLRQKESELESVKEEHHMKECELKSLKEDLCLKVSELGSVKEELYLKESELKSLEDDLCLKDSKLKSLKEDLSLKDGELDSAKEDVCLKETELKSLKEDLSVKDSDLESLKEDLRLKESELKSLREDLCVEESKLKLLKEDLCLKDGELKTLKDLSVNDSELKSVKENLSLKESELKLLKEDISLKNCELQSLKEDLSMKVSELESLKENLYQKENELDSVKEELYLKEGELKSLKEDLSLKDGKLESMKEDLCVKESELKSLKEDLSLKDSDLESLKNGAFSMENDNKVLKEELNEKEKRILELESDLKALRNEASTVVLFAEEKRRLEGEMDRIRFEKERLQEELQEEIKKVAQFEAEATELQMKAVDAVKLREELERELSAKRVEVAAKEDELESLKVDINRLSPFEDMNKDLKRELNESKKKVSELESELAIIRGKVAIFNAVKEEKDKLAQELETKSKQLQDQEIMVKYLEDRVQSKKTDFDTEKVQLKKLMASQVEKYVRENEILKKDLESVRSTIKENIESANPEQNVSELTDIEELVTCLIASIKKSKSKHFVELREKFKTHLTELTIKLRRSETSDKEGRQRLEETESKLKKYMEEIRKIGDLEKTLTALSERASKFETDLEIARKAEAACLKRLQQLSCVPEGDVNFCLTIIEQLLLAKAGHLNKVPENTDGRSSEKVGSDKLVQTDVELVACQRDAKMLSEINLLELRRVKIELSEKEEANCKLSSKVAELTSRCEECTAKISTLERLLADAQERTIEAAPEAQTKSLLSKLTAKENQIEELQQQLREERSKSWLKSPMRGSYSSVEDEYKQRIELLSKDLKKQTQLAESLAASLEEQRRLYSESVSKAVVAAERKETARLKEECEHIKEQLSTVTKSLETLQYEKKGLATQLADAKVKLQTADSASGRSVGDTSDSLLKQQVKDLQEEVTKKNAEIEELNERVKELDWECEEVASELKRTRCREEKFYNEVEESAKTIKKLRQAEQDLDKALAQKQQELSAALLELEERKENDKARKTKVSPLIAKGQLWHSTDSCSSTSAQKDFIGSHLLPSKIALSENAPEGCQCDALKQQIKTLRTDLSNAKGRHVELEMELKRQNYPFKKKIEALESEMKYLKNANSELRADNRRLQNTYADNTVQGCESCRMRLQNRSSVEVQTEGEPVRDLWLSGKTSGIVEEGNRLILEDRIRKLEKEKGMLVVLCKERAKVIKDLEAQLKQHAKEGEC